MFGNVKSNSDRRPSEHEIDETKAPGCQKRRGIGETGLREDGGRVESLLRSDKFSKTESQLTMMLMPHICWPIMTIPEA